MRRKPFCAKGKYPHAITGRCNMLLRRCNTVLQNRTEPETKGLGQSRWIAGFLSIYMSARGAFGNSILRVWFVAESALGLARLLHGVILPSGWPGGMGD